MATFIKVVVVASGGVKKKEGVRACLPRPEVCGGRHPRKRKKCPTREEELGIPACGPILGSRRQIVASALPLPVGHVRAVVNVLCLGVVKIAVKGEVLVARSIT